MIRAFTVTNRRGERLRFNLSNPEETGLNIFNIEGLGPGKTNVIFQNYANIDGAYLSGSRRDVRSVTIAIVFLEEYGIEQMRHKTYKYFPLGETIDIIFETDTRVLKGTFIVEGNEPVIFSSEEFTQVALIAPDPNLYGAEGEDLPTAILDNNGDPLLNTVNTLPKNRWIEDYTRNVYDGNIINGGAVYPASAGTGGYTDPFPIDYDGEANIGAIFTYTTEVEFLPNTRDLQILTAHPSDGSNGGWLVLSKDTMMDIINSSTDYTTINRIVINSIKGQRSVTATSDGNSAAPLDLTGAIIPKAYPGDASSIYWPILHIGNNTIQFTPPHGTLSPDAILRMRVQGSKAFVGV